MTAVFLTFSAVGSLIYAVRMDSGMLQSENAVPAFSLARMKTGYSQSVDFPSLLAQNPETVGWISIPSLGIDRPIVQAEDNSKYLSTAFDGTGSREGAVFADWECDPSLLGRHTVIYAHNLRDGCMFGALETLCGGENDCLEELDVVLYTPTREIPLQIVKAEIAQTNAKRRTTDFASDAELCEFALNEFGIERSELYTEDGAARLYTFITCSGVGEDMRVYVSAVERR